MINPANGEYVSFIDVADMVSHTCSGVHAVGRRFVPMTRTSHRLNIDDIDVFTGSTQIV
jgi:hypothetical protein